jgi:hypothetical protein
MKLGRGAFRKGWLDVVDWAVGVEEEDFWAGGCGLWAVDLVVDWLDWLDWA